MHILIKEDLPACHPKTWHRFMFLLELYEAVSSITWADTVAHFCLVCISFMATDAEVSFHILYGYFQLVTCKFCFLIHSPFSILGIFFLDITIPVPTKLLFSYIYSAENIFNLNRHVFQLHAHFFLITAHSCFMDDLFC